MNFQPVVPMSGYVGWAFLQRTKDSQQNAMNDSARIKRDTQYFHDNIGKISSAEELISDRRLLSIALGAFGLGDDIGNKFFIQKVLEDGVVDSKALSNRLADKRYFEMSKAFGFGNAPVANTVMPGFSERIVTAYQDQAFESAVGEQDENMRLALGVNRELVTLLAKDTTDNGYWFTVMGTPPLRRVFEAALGMPAGVGGLDIDRQVDEFRDRAERIFGDGEVTQFADPARREKLVRRFLIQAESESSFSSTTGSSIALALLQMIRPS